MFLTATPRDPCTLPFARSSQLVVGSCNGKKRDRLPACKHLATWTERNGRYGEQIRAALEDRGIVSQLGASNRVAAWAYAQTEAAGGLTWLRGDDMIPLDASWRGLLTDAPGV